MPTEYDNTNKGALFKNSKRTSDKAPEYNGTLNIEGTDYWISAWVREGKAGKFFSLAIQPKEGKPQSSGRRDDRRDDRDGRENYSRDRRDDRRDPPPRGKPMDDDSIPF